jgi:CO/xanthine dehydrogenase Mo-binding subunit
MERRCSIRAVFHATGKRVREPPIRIENLLAA